MSSFSVSSSAIDWDWLENDRSFKNYKDLLFDIYYNPEKYVEGGPSVENDYFAIYNYIKNNPQAWIEKVVNQKEIQQWQNF